MVAARKSNVSRRIERRNGRRRKGGGRKGSYLAGGKETERSEGIEGGG